MPEISVLVVDHTESMRERLAEILWNDGFRILGEGSNGHEAIELYDQLMPDIVAMDVLMPELSGIDASKNLLLKHPNARIVMCSGFGQKGLAKMAIHNGARDYIAKPYKPEDVTATFRRVMGKSR